MSIAAMVPIFTHDIGGQSLRRLSDEELLTGLFRAGGKEMHFIDGRQALTTLSVAPPAIEQVITALRANGSQPDHSP